MLLDSDVMALAKWILAATWPRRLFLGLCFGLFAGPVAAQPPSVDAEFVPQAGLLLSDLMQLVAEHDPALQQERLGVETARAQVRQSGLWENPVLDAGVGTIPIGAANPPDLPAPLSNIPNYSIGLSLHPDLARRPVRRRQAQALLGASQAQLHAATRERALGLARVLGALAGATLRIEIKRSLVEQGRDALKIAQTRVESGYSAPLEASRQEIDLLRLEEQLLELEGESSAALANCAEYLGARCRRFASPEDAHTFLLRWAEQLSGQISPSLAALEERPDLQVLLAQRAAANAELRLSRVQLVPDPTLRFGYLYDRFVASGNQMHSLNVSLALPLPLLDHGQAVAQTAAARVHHIEGERQRRLAAAQARIEALLASLALQKRRTQILQSKTLPRARAILADLRRAFEQRTLRLTELLLARNTLDELLLAEADALIDGFNTSLELLAQLPGSQSALGVNQDNR